MLGTTLIIEGAEGECGGNNVKTELFRFTSINKKGDITSRSVERRIEFSK